MVMIKYKLFDLHRTAEIQATSLFLYVVVKGLSLEECCNVGACSDGSVIRSLGEVTLDN
ncbi:pfkB-type carbohydrate kinase family protein, putative [Medicago truncatula]|uniref:PfkB-type carbohydrate kinase family protein, putative n=1 Tax=Medicago truncatula TaxID=3880 RepID=G7JJC8_MEDTR|nr:pfkB-type carbohydrate kinase family protein, putative [Medicago truncatula]